MQHFLQTFVTGNSLVQKKLARLRMCALIALTMTAVWLLIPQPAEMAEAPVQTLSGLTVALDPGHGGYDGGARAHDSGKWEKELTLQIALAVENALRSRGAEVVLTRREDICLCEGDTATKARKRADLMARRQTAEEAGADVLLSIHLNEYRSRAESGPQVFYQKGGDDGRLLAGAMQEAMIAVLNPAKQRKAMAGDYYVLRGKLPSVLVECGFLSNAEEEKKLLDPSYQRLIGEAVAQGLENWLDVRGKIAPKDC